AHGCFRLPWRTARATRVFARSGPVERHDDRRVVARPELALRFGAACRGGQLAACQHVVDAPADVALTKTTPWRPPGEQFIVVRVEGTADIGQVLVDEGRQPLAFLRPRADLVRLALLRVHVALLAGHVQVATDQ